MDKIMKYSHLKKDFPCICPNRYYIFWQALENWIGVIVIVRVIANEKMTRKDGKE